MLLAGSGRRLRAVGGGEAVFIGDSKGKLRAAAAHAGPTLVAKEPSRVRNVDRTCHVGRNFRASRATNGVARAIVPWSARRIAPA